jgi:hypothetical protein
MLAGHRDREDDNPLASDGTAKSPASPASEASAGAPPPQETLKPRNEEPETEDSEEPEEREKEESRSYSKIPLRFPIRHLAKSRETPRTRSLRLQDAPE